MFKPRSFPDASWQSELKFLFSGLPQPVSYLSHLCDEMLDKMEPKRMTALGSRFEGALYGRNGWWQSSRFEAL